MDTASMPSASATATACATYRSTPGARRGGSDRGRIQICAAPSPMTASSSTLPHPSRTDTVYPTRLRRIHKEISMAARVPALVVGGGSVGLFAALLLRRHGVPPVLVER